MPFLSTIFSMLGGSIIEKVLEPAKEIFQAYFNKQISEAELREKLLQALLSSVTQIEQAHAEALSKTYASFMQAAAQSPFMQRIWGCAVLSQLFVLFWYQFIVPAMTAVVHYYGATRWFFPSPGETVVWAYALLGGLLGLGPLALRAGPGASDIAARLKSMIGK